MVADAKVSALNTATGSLRDATSGADGSVTLAALPLNGAYTITVTKPGFTTEKIADVSLRSGETASVRVKLVASGGRSEVTVYGTTQGVRADPEIGTRLDANLIEEVPLLGRKISYLPLLNSAFRPAKGTGDLFMNSIYVVTGAGGRREADYVVDGAMGDEPWGRQTMFSTIPVGRGPGNEHHVARVLGRVRLDRERRHQHRHQVRRQRDAWRGALPRAARRTCNRQRSQPTRQCPGSISSCVAPTVNGGAAALGTARTPGRARPGLVRHRRGDRQGSDALLRGGRLHPPGSHGGDHHAARGAGYDDLGNYRQALVNARLDHR